MHVRLSAAAEAFDLPLIADYSISCEDDEAWSFEAFLACHRAQGALEIITTHQGKTKIHTVDFASGKVGGLVSQGYQSAKVKLELQKGTTFLSLNLKHSNVIYEVKD